MDQIQAVEPLEEKNEGQEAENGKQSEEAKPMPFGMIGISLLCNITQYAVFFGLTMLILMFIRIFGPK